MKARVSRRRFLHRGAGAAAALASFGARAAGGAEAAANAAPRSVVFVRLEGGADALSLLVPYRSAEYYRARPHVAVPAPGRGVGCALPLDEHFALHPALSGLKPLYDAGEMGILAGTGFSARCASHQRAQQALDAAIVGALGGWQPEAMAGELGSQLARAAAALQAPLPPRALLLESFGWDTHLAQPARLALLLAELSAALLAFRAQLGPFTGAVQVIVTTEFGRSLGETILGGTDDGHASVLLVLGGQRWGRVMGRYAGLEPGAGCAGNALAPTSELDVVLSRLVRGELPV